MYSSRWASAILVRTSAIPQYCGIPNRLRNCGLKKVAELRLRTFKIWLPQFRNFLHSPASYPSLCIPLILSSGCFENQSKAIFTSLFQWKPKTCLKGTVARDFWPLIFSWIDPIWIPDSYPKFGVLQFETDFENLLEYYSGVHIRFIHEKTEAENPVLLPL